MTPSLKSLAAGRRLETTSYSQHRPLSPHLNLSSPSSRNSLLPDVRWSQPGISSRP